MINQRAMRVGAAAVGFWLLIDLIRAWAPSVANVGFHSSEHHWQVTTTYVICCVAVLLVILGLVRNRQRWHCRMLMGSIVIALACRIAVQFSAGGVTQLIASSAGIIAILLWAGLLAQILGDVLVQGIAIGLATSSITHAALGTWAAVWRWDIFSITFLLAQSVLVVVFYRRGFNPRRCSASQAFLALPAVLIIAAMTSNPGRASAAAGSWGLLAVSVGAVAAIAVPYVPIKRPVAWVAAAALNVSIVVPLLVRTDTDGVWGVSPTAVVVIFLVGTPSVLYLLSVVQCGCKPSTITVGLGAVACFAVFGIDFALQLISVEANLGLLVLTIMFSLLCAVRARSSMRLREFTMADSNITVLSRFGVIVVVASVASIWGPSLTITSVATTADETAQLRVAAGNMQGGFGSSARFEPKLLAKAIANTDIAMISDLDRGWLSSGGQDQVAILSRLLGSTARFGPSADPLRGDAVFSRLPVVSQISYPLPPHGSASTAQSLAVQLIWQRQPIWAIATHLQPRKGTSDVQAQAHDLAQLIQPMVTDGASIIIGGDLNTPHDSDAIRALSSAGLHPAFDLNSIDSQTLSTLTADAYSHLLATPDLIGTNSAILTGQNFRPPPVAVTIKRK